MNKITQITIKKREEKSTLLLYFNSAQTQTKQKSGTELRCYICNFNNRPVCICISKEALMKQNNGGKNMNILATRKMTLISQTQLKE